MTAQTTLATPNIGARLVSTDGRALPFRGGQLAVDAAAGLARIVLRQEFVNPYPEPLRVTYTLPLPSDAAVSGFAFEIGAERIVGTVDTKRKARERFEEAIVEGRTAAILEQERSSLFHQEVGNIPPGQSVTCEIVLDQRLRWGAGGWRWRFPTVVAPRYGDDPARAKVPLEVDEAGTAARMSLAVTVRDARTGPISSPSHALHVQEEATQATAGLAAEAGAALDRDIVVTWPVAAPAPGARLELGRDQQEEIAGLLTLVPPAQPLAAVPRDLVLLLDTSGSMRGSPLAQAKAVSLALIDSLGPADHLQVIEFSTRPRAWRADPVAMSPAEKAAAVAWVSGLSSGGGTEMRTGILAALETLRDEAQRQVILVTDGLISFEKQITGAIARDLPRGCRVHTLGIGSSVNRTLLTSAARAGGGEEVIVGIGEPADKAAAALVAATAAPQVVDVTLSGDALLAVDHHRIPDLMAGRPARIALRLRPSGGQLVAQGHTAQGPWRAVLSVPPMAPAAGNPAVVTLVGRERVAELELKAALGGAMDAEIEAIGLRYQIATRLTSWVAISAAPTVDATAPTRDAVVPQALPHGMSATGLGLRAPAASTVLAATSGLARGARSLRSEGALGGSKGGGRADLKRKRNMRRPSAPKKTSPMAPPPPGMAPPAPQSAPYPAPEAEREAFAEAPKEVTDAFFSDAADEDDAASFDAPEPTPVSAPAPVPVAPHRVLSGRVLLAKGGRRVLELIVDTPLAWLLPRSVRVVLADGRTISVRVDEKATTRAGRAAAGLRLRLAFDAPDLDGVDISGGKVEATFSDGRTVTIQL